MNKRFIKFDNINNFRDLKGLKTKDNLKVKEGYFFRSARLDIMTKDDQDKLIDLNIKTIYDFRHYDEAIKHVTKPIPNTQIYILPALNDVDEAVSEDVIKEMMMKNDFSLFEKVLIKNYQDLPFNNEAYLLMLHRIKRMDGNAILMHCTGGRDRTGVLSALVLLLLGVERKEIVEDYMLSVEGLKDYYHTLMKEVKIDEELKNKIIKAIEVKESYINAMLDSIDEKYSSIEEFFEKEYYLSKEDIKKIREYYLER